MIFKAETSRVQEVEILQLLKIENLDPVPRWGSQNCNKAIYWKYLKIFSNCNCRFLSR